MESSKKLEEGDFILCTVDRIVGTSVFVKIEGGGEGSLTVSEVAPGRIRNLRDYVSPGRRIVCKILRIDDAHVYLSLRRVSLKERKEVMDAHEKEKNALTALRVVLKEKAESTAEKIKEENTRLSEVLQKAKDNPAILEKYMSKEEAEKVAKIIKSKKEKLFEVKKEITLKSNSPRGVDVIKSVLSACTNKCDVSYLAAGKYQLKIRGKDYKEANLRLSSIISEMEASSKKEKAEFAVKEK